MIPGAFDIGSLQDEMTGVSLAGTQLRVNQYDMHDVEWNEVRVTTINGARVLEDKKDIHIPQVSDRRQKEGGNGIIITKPPCILYLHFFDQEPKQMTKPLEW